MTLTEDLFEIERLKDTYSYPSRKDRKYKVLYAGDKLSYAGIKYQYRLEVNRKERRVYLCIYNKYDELIERKVCWSFDYLKERLMRKLKSFDKFLELLEAGYIKLVIKVGIYLDEKRYGNTYDHGCGFAIKDDDVCKLYYKCKIN